MYLLPHKLRKPSSPKRVSEFAEFVGQPKIAATNSSTPYLSLAYKPRLQQKSNPYRLLPFNGKSNASVGLVSFGLALKLAV